MSLRRPPLVESVVEEVLRILSRHDQNRPLPSELSLAQELGVSRPTIREALQRLEGAGHIVRRRGVGSFVAPRAHPIEAGIETLQSYMETIALAGHRPRNLVLHIGKMQLPKSIAGQLGSENNRAGFLVESLYYADGAPVIFSKVQVRADVVQSLEQLKARRHFTSMHEFLERQRGMSVHYARRSVSAERASSRVATLLRLKKGDPVLILAGVSYGDRDLPLMYTKSYFRTDKYRFTLVRRPRDFS